MLTKIQNFLQSRRHSAALRERFSAVHRENAWRGKETTSGQGSDRDSHSVQAAIPAILRAVNEYAIGSISDIPCGDFNWQTMFLEKLPAVQYQGFDIVPHVVEENRRKAPRYKFTVFDVVNRVPPRADMILCKDLLNHLADKDVKKAVENMRRSGSTYLLASNNPGFEHVPLVVADGGASRHLDITIAPFNYRKPLWTDNIDYMGFWRLADIGECAF